MPIYEYQCKACNHKMEKLQKISDDPLKLCPECGKPELTKLISAAAFRLKGDGWYETDFKTGKKKNVSAGDSSSAGKSSKSSSATKSEKAGSSSKSSTSKSDSAS